ncbi:MAG TPA: L,D-transpeptidase [Rudaea sp.]|nr:L,D-transpeptidase [Rudaea sp.]
MSLRPSTWLLFALLTRAAAVAALLVGPQAALAIDPDPAALRRGEYVWHPEIAPSGPLVLLVSLDEQRAYVYRNGIAIGVTTISTGKRGYRTQPGVFTILQKKVIAYSNLYDNAPMPFMQRLTWDGVAMHGGVLPGYPASHGCIRLPQKFAKKLFAVTKVGVVVAIVDRKSAPESVVHPALLAPIAGNGLPLAQTTDATDFWNDAPAASGPVSILVTTRDRRVRVFRDGAPIAASRFEAAEPPFVGGSVLYVMGDATEYAPSPLDPTQPKHQWFVYPIATRKHPAPRADAPGALRLPPDFARRLYAVLTPGTTVLVTDLPSIRAE